MYNSILEISQIVWGYNAGERTSHILDKPSCSGLKIKNTGGSPIWIYDASIQDPALDASMTPMLRLNANESFEFINPPNCYILQKFAIASFFQSGGYIENKYDLTFITHQLM